MLFSGETFLKFLAGKENAALYSAQRQIHVLGDFIVFISGYMHRERNAVFVGEFVDGVGDFVCAVGLLGRFETAVLAEVEMIEVVGCIDYCGRTHAAAVVVDEDIPHDGENPTLEVCVFSILVFIVKRLERCVLKKIVSVVTVLGEHECEVQ